MLATTYALSLLMTAWLAWRAGYGIAQRLTAETIARSIVARSVLCLTADERDVFNKLMNKMDPGSGDRK